MAEPSLKKRIWGWYFFDWASQPYHTVLLTFIFGPFFASVAAESFMTADFRITVDPTQWLANSMSGFIRHRDTV